MQWSAAARTPIASTSRAVFSSPIRSRSFATTFSTRNFLFRKPAPPTLSLNELSAVVLDACAEDKLDVVRQNYSALRNELEDRKASDLDRRRSRKLLGSILQYTSTTPALSLSLRIFADLQALGTPIEDDVTYMVSAFVKARAPKKAFAWLRAQEDTHGHAPNIRNYNVVLSAYRRAGDWKGFDQVLEALSRPGGPRFSTVTYNILIRAAFERNDLDDVRKWKASLEADEHNHPDVVTEATLLDGFALANETSSALKIRELLDARLDTYLKEGKRERSTEPPDPVALAVLVKHECIVAGIENGISLALRLRSHGFELGQGAFSSVAFSASRHLETAQEALDLVSRLESVFGSPATAKTWSIFIDALSKTSQSDQALSLYQSARDLSVTPDSGMIQPILLSLPRTSANLSVARGLYEDFIAIASPDLLVYHALFDFCGALPSPSLDFVQNLVEDMRYRSFAFDEHALPKQIIPLMRAMNTHEDAFKVYDNLRALSVDALTTKGYNAILTAFLNLESDDGVASKAYVREFLQDMRRSKSPPDVATYAILLDYYARIRSLSSIQHIHDLIKVETLLDPDVTLFNALMCGYSYVRAWGQAYRVWDTMRGLRGGPHELGQIDNASVSILLDTCGWDGSPGGLSRARTEWRKLQDGSGRFALNSKNFDAYIECLCRTGQLDEAEALAFKEEQLGSSTPFALLVKFARRSGDEDRATAVLARVRKEKPHLVTEVESQLTAKR